MLGMTIDSGARIQELTKLCVCWCAFTEINIHLSNSCPRVTFYYTTQKFHRLHIPTLALRHPGSFWKSDWCCIKYLNNVIYPRPSRIILRYLRPACLYFTCNKPCDTTMCLMFDCVRKVVDSLVCYSVKVSTFQPVSPLASRERLLR